MVSKAVGNSVVRHRVARRIRGAVTPLIATLPPGTRVVVRALAGAGTDASLAHSVADGVVAALDRRGGVA